MPDLTVLSLGAGVQSTTLLLMSVEGVLPKPDCAIFADTGWEPKAVYRHLEWLKETAESAGIPVYVVSAGNIYEDVLRSVRGEETHIGQPPFFVRNADGEKGILLRKCTTDYKIVPINRKIRELLGVKPGERVPKGVLVEQWFGISMDEAQRMRVARDKWIQNRYPLIFDVHPPMDRLSCLEWLKRHGYSIPPKSACIGCPFHSDAMWRELRDSSPEEWQQAVEWDRAIRRGLPGVNGEAYVHRSLVPLEEVDLRTLREKGQTTLWDDDFSMECEGMCGL